MKIEIKDNDGYTWRITTEHDTYTGGTIYNVNLWKGRKHIYVIGLPDHQNNKTYSAGETIDLIIRYKEAEGETYKNELT